VLKYTAVLWPPGPHHQARDFDRNGRSEMRRRSCAHRTFIDAASGGHRTRIARL